MSTYYPSLSSQKENLQSRYPGDHKISSYSELPSHPNNMTMYVNQASAAGAYSEFLTESSLSSDHCAEFASSGDGNEMMFIPPTSATMSLQPIDGHLNTASTDPAGNHVSEQNFQCQGLSLRLGTEMQPAVSVPSFQYQNPSLVLPSLSSPHLPVMGKWTLSSGGGENHQSNLIRTEVSRNPQCLDAQKDMHTDAYMYETCGYANATSNSKYLKAAQQLLDEVVNLRKALKQLQSNKCFDDIKENDGKPSSQSILPTSSGISSGPNESTANSSSELSSAERQDLQNKKIKLLSMLDEVDRRYKEYYHQMQIVVSSFDLVAGQGAAKSYTALAIQTISRHFRCLRDAISNQIEITRRRLGEQSNSPNGQGGIPRLRYVDQQLRQQRALQQFGVMRHAWRPQRGLPESSVSILRAWLFEHFLHPYPNDSEKITLAKQTGLTRNQVANWFINARVRLWKPMVEEIYKEEFADSEANSKSSLDDATKALGENQLVSENRLDELQDSLTSAAADSNHTGQVHALKFDPLLDIEMNKPVAKTVLQNNSLGDVTNSRITKLQGNQRSNMDEQSPYLDKDIPGNQHGDESLMPAALSYDVSEFSGFAIGNQVSLALGLQYHESDAFPTSGGNQIRGNNIAASSMGPDTIDYHCIYMGKQQDRLGNSHLLRDFVV